MNKLIDTLERNNGIKLTEKQKTVVNHLTGPALVLSCAGSGKTTVNIIKCANLVLEHGVDPSNILSVTFSKAAALEMEARFIKLFGGMIDRSLKFSTIHGLAYRIINEYAVKNRIKLTLIEGEKSPINKQALIKELNLKYNDERINDDKLDELLNAISYCKNMMLSSQEVQVLSKSVTNLSSILKEYELFKRTNNLVDFDDMLTLCNDYLNTDSALLEKYRRQYKYIIVDEAQDTSKIQYNIIEKLAHPNNNLTLIGDDDQAIYGFRGAYPDYLLGFWNKYPNGKIFYLDENFRSTGSIVDHAGKLINNNTVRYVKDIRTSNPVGASVSVVEVKSSEDQLRYLSDTARSNVDQSQIAVLYRNNISSIALVDFLDREGVSFYLRDYDESFFKHWVIADILAYLNLALDRSSIESYRRIYFKTGQYISKNAFDHAERNISKMSIFESLLDFYKDDSRMTASVTLLIKCFNSVKQLRPEVAVAYIRSAMGYEEYLEKNAEKQGYSLDNLKGLLSTLEFIAKSAPTTEDFFRRLQVLKEKMANGKFNKHKNAVTLSTIHSAKGLEFSDVYIIDLFDDTFPGRSAIKAFEEGNIEAMEEERRVYYVAITRAKNKLTLIGTRSKNGRIVDCSRFLSESTKILQPTMVTREYIPANSVRSTFTENSYKPVTTTKKKRESLTGIVIGTRVYHRKFGEGTITELDNEDSITVEFDNNSYGTKKLSLSICMDSEIITPI